jgi:hypothetical protein
MPTEVVNFIRATGATWLRNETLGRRESQHVACMCSVALDSIGGTWFELRFVRMRVVAFLITALALQACEPPGYGKHGEVDASAGSGSGTVDGGRTAVDAAPDSPPGVCDNAFRLDGHGAAGSVYVTGDFCMWGDANHGGFVLAKQADGAWTGTRLFAPGTYLYKFVVDGSMYLADPNNPHVADDGFGGHNSVYTCQL